MYALTYYGRYGAPIRVELARIGVQFVQGNPVNEGQVSTGLARTIKYSNKDHVRITATRSRRSVADRHARACNLHFTACATAAQVQMQMALADDGTVLVHWTKSRTGPIQLVERALLTAAYGASTADPTVRCGRPGCTRGATANAHPLGLRCLVCFVSIACSFLCARIGGADGWRTMLRPYAACRTSLQRVASRSI